MSEESRFLAIFGSSGSSGGGGGSVNIYNADGTLLADRTVEQDGNHITVKNSLNNSELTFRSDGYIVNQNMATSNFLLLTNPTGTRKLLYNVNNFEVRQDFSFFRDTTNSNTYIKFTHLRAMADWVFNNVFKHRIHAQYNSYFYSQGFSGTNQYLTIGSTTRLGTESISLQGHTLVKGADTLSTSSALQIYDGDGTPNLLWDFKNNGNANIKDGSILLGRLGISKASPSVSTNPLFALTVIGETTDATKGTLCCINSSGANVFRVSNEGKVEIENDTSINSGFLNIGNTNLEGFWKMGVRSNTPLVLKDSSNVKLVSFAFDGNRFAQKTKFGQDSAPTSMVDIVGENTSASSSALKVMDSSSTSLYDFRNNGDLIGANGARIKNVVVNPSVQEVASTTTFTVNSDEETMGVLTSMSAIVDTLIASPTGTPVQGQKLVYRFTDDGTSRGIIWNSVFRAIGVTLPTSTTPNKLLYVGCFYNSTDTKWDIISVQEEA